MNKVPSTPTDTTASTVQLVDHPPITSQDMGGMDMLAMGGIGAIGVWQAGRVIVRRFFKDSTEIAKDRAETNILEVLRQDNATLHDKMEVLSKERNDAVSQLGRFLGETELYREKISELQKAVVLMTSKLEEQSILLRNVLVENARLKSQIEHLEGSNTKLGLEIHSLRQSFSSVNIPLGE